MLAALRFSPDKDIQRFVEKYDQMPAGDRGKLPWEAIIVSLDMDPRTFLGACQMALSEQSATTVQLMAASAHPDVMKARIKFALEQPGKGDRDSFQTIVGAMPTPKGMSISINNPVGHLGSGQIMNDALPESAEESDQDDDEIDMDNLFPDPEILQTKVAAHRQKLLESK